MMRGLERRPSSNLPGSLGCFAGSARRLKKAGWLGAWALVSFAAFSTIVLAGKKEKKVSRTVTGMVLDEAENGIVGATVTLTDLQAKEASTTVTKESGQYQFSDLNPAHDYEVQAGNKGLSSDVRRVSSFDQRNRIVLNLRIPPPKEQ